MNRPKPYVGQTLWEVPVGNRVRRYIENKASPGTVTKVSRKYFTVTFGRMEVEFHLDTWRQKTEYCVDYQLYETEQEYLDKKEKDEICILIWKSFEYGRNPKDFSLDMLRKISSLIS